MDSLSYKEDPCGINLDIPEPVKVWVPRFHRFVLPGVYVPMVVDGPKWVHDVTTGTMSNLTEWWLFYEVDLAPNPAWTNYANTFSLVGQVPSSQFVETITWAFTDGVVSYNLQLPEGLSMNRSFDRSGTYGVFVDLYSPQGDLVYFVQLYFNVVGVSNAIWLPLVCR